MTSKRRVAGLQKRLLDRSVEAYILSLETINRLAITYRVETFTYLICNAWELLLKAKIAQDVGSSRAIYYPRKRGQPLRSLSLRKCLQDTFPKENDPVRRNIEFVEELRDEATHLVIKHVPNDVLGLFQACVLNYHRYLHAWFGIALSDRVTVGMMSIVYDRAPEQFDLGNAAFRRELGRDTAQYLARFQAQLRKEWALLGQSAELAIDVRYHLVLTKKPGDADIILTTGDSGSAMHVVEVPKDPSKTHPYRQKELLVEVNARLAGATSINTYDIQCVAKAFNIARRAEFYYKSSIKGTPAQYSPQFVDWLIAQYQKDPAFFLKARARTGTKSKRRVSLSEQQRVPPPDADVLPSPLDELPVPISTSRPVSIRTGAAQT